MLLGVDTGGTFTDFVYIGEQGVQTHKVLSTPDSPERAILQGIKELGVDDTTLLIVHGSTVATNAVLEKKGARCCFITNTGFADMLTIGRQARKELYNLNPPVEAPPVPAELCLEVSGRLSASGERVDVLKADDLLRLTKILNQLAPQSVAINCLFSFLNDEDERRIETAVPAGIAVSRSSNILPEYKEYERGMATWLNAYVGPLVTGYLKRLTESVKARSVSVMQSSAGTIAATQAGEHAVRMLLSGPAGGLMGALHIGKLAGYERLLTLDMGGTSTDVSLLDGAISLTSEGKIAGYPVAVPMVDMHTIGAGGGSIAYVDEGGMLCVGPESAGASPGPACYGQRGVNVTVTDANLFLGRISEAHFLGGSMALDMNACTLAIKRLAVALNCCPQEAAKGVIELANEHMARALRVISIQRGIDPSPYALMTFGGAGSLHVCALADTLQMDTAIVPVHSGVLSAFGMLAAPKSRELSKSLVGILVEIPVDVVEARFASMQQQGTQALMDEVVPDHKIHTAYLVDLRYLGQSYTLRVPWANKQQAIEGFHQQHKKRYGHALDLPVELVNLRVSLTAKLPAPRMVSLSTRDSSRVVERSSHAGKGMAIYQRENLLAGDLIVGEALVVETVATTYLAPGWQCKVDELGNLMLTRV
ncbi:MAG: hydantoinase [Piscirickettsiaceae bacterium]|nr:MAG: hydantoinase [Piscirickettsiaceae bacterium]